MTPSFCPLVAPVAQDPGAGCVPHSLQGGDAEARRAPNSEVGGARETPREAGTGRWAVGLSWRSGEPDGEKRGWKAKVGAEVPREQPPR